MDICKTRPDCRRKDVIWLFRAGELNRTLSLNTKCIHILTENVAIHHWSDDFIIIENYYEKFIR